MQSITKREAKVFVKDTCFTFFCCFSAMSETLFFGVGDYNSVKTTTYLALTDEVRDVSFHWMLVCQFPVQANSIRGFLERVTRRYLTFLCVRTCSLYLLCVYSLQYTLLCGFFHLNKIEPFLERLPVLNVVLYIVVKVTGERPFTNEIDAVVLRLLFFFISFVFFLSDIRFVAFLLRSIVQKKPDSRCLSIKEHIQKWCTALALMFNAIRIVT